MEYERPTVVDVSVKIDTTTYQGPDGVALFAGAKDVLGL